MARPSFADADYQQLLKLRTNLRRFLAWSERQAHAVGLTPAQHQLLLAIRGHDDPRGPTIAQVADYLMLKQHSAAELIRRAAARGLLERDSYSGDAYAVRLTLTVKGAAALEQLAPPHLEELSRLARDFWPLRQALPSGRGRSAGNGGSH